MAEGDACWGELAVAAWHRPKGVFDGVALELGCTPGSSICCLVSFFCSSARPAGAKKVKDRYGEPERGGGVNGSR
jgi:hypothetical protein